MNQTGRVMVSAEKVKRLEQQNQEMLAMLKHIAEAQGREFASAFDLYDVELLIKKVEGK